MEEQLTIGKVYISAFLQHSLQGKTGYENLFRDYRTGIDWLPETIYLNQYENSDWRVLADFEEDLDLSTTSAGGTISTENLTVWREQLVSMKYGNKVTRAAYLGWDSLAFEGAPARYTLDLAKPIDATLTPSLSMELSDAKENTYPDKERDREAKEEEEDHEEQNEGEEKEEADEENQEEGDDEEKKAPEPLDFSLIFTDDQGNQATVKLSDYGYLQRQITVDVLKNPELQSTKTSEAVYNTFLIDLSALKKEGVVFNNGSITKIEWVFDQNPLYFGKGSHTLATPHFIPKTSKLSQYGTISQEAIKKYQPFKAIKLRDTLR